MDLHISHFFSISFSSFLFFHLISWNPTFITFFGFGGDVLF
jgi:hypothetical protein